MTKKTAWSHLPNAAHIDRIIASVKSHPEAWAATGDAAWYQAWYAAREAVWDAARDAVSDAAVDEAWYAAWYAAREAARYAVGDAARYAVLALIAWDHSAKFLDMTSNELMMWRELSENPACMLLLPAVRAFEQIKELELV